MKKIGVAFLIIGIACVVAGYWLWSQVTWLPKWYEEEAAGVKLDSVIFYDIGIDAMKSGLEKRIEAQVQKKSNGGSHVEVKLNEKDARELLAVFIAENAKKYGCREGIKASKAQIRNGNLDLDVILNPSEVLRKKPDQNEKVGFKNDLLGMFSDKEVCVGVTGGYALKGKKVKIAEDGKISIGSLSFSTKKLLKRLGIKEEKLKDPIGQLKLGKLRIEDIRMVKDSLILRSRLPDE